MPQLDPNATVASVIPEGPYCYTYKSGEYYRCPFWSRVKGKEYQEDGYCSFLGRGDWEHEEGEGMGLLWDQCKECGINDIDMWYD